MFISCLLLIGLLVNSRLLVDKFGGSPNFYEDFWLLPAPLPFTIVNLSYGVSVFSKCFSFSGFGPMSANPGCDSGYYCLSRFGEWRLALLAPVLWWLQKEVLFCKVRPAFCSCKDESGDLTPKLFACWRWNQKPLVTQFLLLNQFGRQRVSCCLRRAFNIWT